MAVMAIRKFGTPRRHIREAWATLDGAVVDARGERSIQYAVNRARPFLIPKMSSLITGMAFVLLAGALGGSTLMPFKYVRNWEWENTWLAYAVIAYLTFPIVSALLTVPNLG